ncbi:MAG: hypothetical protein JJT96_12800 [Opitutales bacterium]|nr:hypothetical protein [Opitutales bacterium]
MKNKTAKNLLIITICLCLAAINLQAAAGHSITLKPGLNLISIPGSPTESGKMAHEALGPVYDRTNAIWRIKESEWQVHVPSRPELSHFSSLQPGSGYFLYLTEGPDPHSFLSEAIFS